ncbi:CobD/CbiB family cobalamin biosynthesis protein [Halorubrum salipaludis]|uniref:Probable cobalamin biosynthesis protein CobD n=1 Tax=Halorubrum salipaludis TaxID=2032630 RepID=A0A2A2FKU1_9EURY|nr:CobD/CbiB family cobalamin biosynthesis protein [Halorubrum salipaludis]PAU85384.1 CobD/CbiB family cobalamin biosynthesis protein [Halorubrum salipaludis]
MATALPLLGSATPLGPALPSLAALAIAVALDLALAEPPTQLHPVALFGSVVGRFDRTWSHPRLVGLAVAVGLPLAAAAVAGVTVAAAGGLPAAGGFPVSPVLVAGALLFASVSLRMLLETTAEVVELTETDPDAARESLRALAGRDATDLSPADLRSAAVESAAENLADGFVAPLGGFALGAAVGLAAGAMAGSAAPVAPSGSALPLAAGTAGAVWVKAVNTLDSMLGYRSKPVGWASARLDDAIMFLPARATAGCLALAAGSLDALRRGTSWAEEPSSPNSGWPMATAAAALDARLEKPGHYVLNPDASPPSVADAERAVRLVGVAGAVAVALAAGWLAAVGWILSPSGVVGWP